jgi:hypothetical protein
VHEAYQAKEDIINVFPVVMRLLAHPVRAFPQTRMNYSSIALFTLWRVGAAIALFMSEVVP